ncbi:MAG: hypothetical protein LQ338_007157, partial [Usnochroma carphineum]
MKKSTENRIKAQEKKEAAKAQRKKDATNAHEPATATSSEIRAVNGDAVLKEQIEYGTTAGVGKNMLRKGESEVDEPGRSSPSSGLGGVRPSLSNESPLTWASDPDAIEPASSPALVPAISLDSASVPSAGPTTEAAHTAPSFPKTPQSGEPPRQILSSVSSKLGPMPAFDPASHLNPTRSPASTPPPPAGPAPTFSHGSSSTSAAAAPSNRSALPESSTKQFPPPCLEKEPVALTHTSSTHPTPPESDVPQVPHSLRLTEEHQTSNAVAGQAHPGSAAARS